MVDLLRSAMLTWRGGLFSMTETPPARFGRRVGRYNTYVGKGFNGYFLLVT